MYTEYIMLSSVQSAVLRFVSSHRVEKGLCGDGVITLAVSGSGTGTGTGTRTMEVNRFRPLSRSGAV